MAHESFEDDATAAVMNQLFVNVKVDREERPDVDAVYMDAVQALTGRGGWPMTVFCTPTGEPFYGGTYYPRETFVKLMEAVDDAWRNLLTWCAPHSMPWQLVACTTTLVAASLATALTKNG